MIFKINKMKNLQNITNHLVHNKDFQQVIGLVTVPLTYRHKCKGSIIKNFCKIKFPKIKDYKDTFISCNQNLLK